MERGRLGRAMLLLMSASPGGVERRWCRRRPSIEVPGHRQQPRPISAAQTWRSARSSGVPFFERRGRRDASRRRKARSGNCTITASLHWFGGCPTPRREADQTRSDSCYWLSRSSQLGRSGCRWQVPAECSSTRSGRFREALFRESASTEPVVRGKTAMSGRLDSARSGDFRSVTEPTISQLQQQPPSAA